MVANGAGTLLNGAKRFFLDGKPLNHHLGVSGFSELTVAAQESLIKLDESFPLDKAALFGCAVMTGVGAVVNTAKVPAGSSVAVFGMGGVGLSAVLGARAAGCSTIIAIDTLPHKLELAKKLGATHVINAKNDDPVKALKDLTQGGPQYVFEAVGNEKVLTQAYTATRRGGTTVTIGLPHPSKQLTIPALSLVAEERTLMGSYMGSAVPRRDVPRYIGMYLSGVLPVDALVSDYIKIENINAAFDTLDKGDAVRQVLRFAK
jgi:alcohol dehydrogenase